VRIPDLVVIETAQFSFAGLPGLQDLSLEAPISVILAFDLAQGI